MLIMKPHLDAISFMPFQVKSKSNEQQPRWINSKSYTLLVHSQSWTKIMYINMSLYCSSFCYSSSKSIRLQPATNLDWNPKPNRETTLKSCTKSSKIRDDHHQRRDPKLGEFWPGVALEMLPLQTRVTRMDSDGATLLSSVSSWKVWQVPARPNPHLLVTWRNLVGYCVWLGDRVLSKVLEFVRGRSGRVWLNILLDGFGTLLELLIEE